MGFLYVEETIIDYNPEIAKNPELVVFSDKTQPYAGNYSFEFIKTVKSFKIYLSLNIPENENDREFRKELLKTVINGDKIFNGVFANPVVKYIVKTIFPSAQFEIKLPFKPVSFNLEVCRNLNLKLPGRLQVREFQGPGPTIPIQSDDLDSNLQHAYCRKH